MSERLATVRPEGEWKRAADVAPGDVQFFAGEWGRVVKVEPIWRSKVRIHHDDLTWREWRNDCRLLVAAPDIGRGSDDA